MATKPRKADLIRWISRFDAVERRIEAERRAHPPTPDRALRRASSLRSFAQDLGALTRVGVPPEEDLRVYRTWDRIRRALLGWHA